MQQSSLLIILPSLYRLTKLVMHGTGSRNDLSRDESLELVPKVFNIAPSLQIVEREIVSQPGDDSEEPVTFMRWQRGEGTPVPRDRFQDVDEWLHY